ncbi:MAG: DUF4153 domain-containing protein [Vicingaceae bacterium]
MDKKTTSIILLTVLYSILFYDQHVGLNFLLFTLALLGLFFFQNKKSFKKRSVQLLSVACIFSATFAVIHGSYLSMWATIISLMLIPGAILNKTSNILIDFATTFINIGGSPAFMIIDSVNSSKDGKSKGFLQVLKYLVPTVFIIAFFFIYRSMNPLFENATQDIADLISLGYVFFTLGGFALVYSIYKQKRAKEVDAWEENNSLNIIEKETKAPQWNEGIAFIILFIVLNIMLISVNFMDIHYLYLGEGMPDGITHKQFLHKGVGMIILSILLGISLLLFFFRGALNFDKNQKLIKLLAFLWVIQNVFMVISTTLRNNIYVDEALLSYKRIGVYFWLLFALIGLITLFVKLLKNKSLWFLMRYNFIVLFVVFIMSSAFDWDMIISKFNINRAKQVNEISSYDKRYLLSLSEGNIAELHSIKEMKGFEVDSLYSYAYDDGFRHSNKNWLDTKVYDFLAGDEDGDWRSYSTRRYKVRKDIQQLNQLGELDTLDLRNSYSIKTIAPLAELTQLKSLNLSGCSITDWENLKLFKSLETLTISYVSAEDIEHFKQLPKLKSLNIESSNVKVLNKFIESLPNVKVY